MIYLRSAKVLFVEPALLLLPIQYSCDEARVMMLAIGLQESKFKFPYQVTSDPYTKGPAKGYWQFERAGGVQGVMSNRLTRADATALCFSREIPFEVSQVWSKLEYDPILAAGFARLLLRTDDKPLPTLDGGHDAAWDCYIRLWRPGKPHRESWDDYHQQSLDLTRTNRGPYHDLSSTGASSS